MQVIPVTRPEQVAEVRQLLIEYAESFSFHICFKAFEQELAALPGAYLPPGGGLWMVRVDGQAAGCVALRALEGRDGVGEVKRLYVRPAFRGRKLGLALIAHLIEEARRIGYQRLWLDTLSAMKSAHAVYTAAGFERTSDAQPGSSEEVWCFEKRL